MSIDTTSPETTPRTTTSLLSDKDFGGWVIDDAVNSGNSDPGHLFSIQNGILTSKANTFGHLITDKTYRNYTLSLDYRLPETGGNGSVLVHVSDLDALRTKSLNKFPKSIEFKIRYKDAGDVYCVQEDIAVADMERYRPRDPGQKWGGGTNDARHIDPLAEAEKAPGEWNRLVLICQDRAIKAWLNGVFIFDGFDCTADRGRIAIQAGGDAVDFRSIQIGPV